MRIGVDAHSLEGLRTGARGRYLLNLIKEWAKIDTGEDQFVLYFQNEIPKKWDFLDSHKFTKKLLRGPLGIKSFSLYYNVLLPLAAQKDKPDVCFFPFYMLPFSYLAKNSVVAIHDLAFVAHPEWFSIRHRLPLLLFSKYAAKHAKYIIVPSKFSKNEVKMRYKTDLSRIKVVYLAPDAIFSNKKDESAENHAKRKIGLKKRYFLSIGTIFNRRFVNRVIEAFSTIARKYPDWQFFISGRDLTNPPLHIDSLIKTANKDAAREAIIRKDFIEDDELVHLYHGADFCVYLSIYEGFGLPPLEAMASGSIALTTNHTALKESVNGAGFIIKNPGDTNELQKTLERLMTDEDLKDGLRKRGGEWVKKFSWEKTAEETLEILRSVAST